MTSFKPLNSKKYTKQTQIQTPDSLYWKKLSSPVLVKEYGGIEYIDFSPVQPHYFAVTCSLRVQIYNPITKLVVKNISSFNENVYGGTFRKDGRLLLAGDETGTVRLFDTSSRNPLRIFRGHTAATHRVAFMADNVHIVSFSDDQSVKLWDVPSEKCVQTFNEHTDYIRAGCANPVTPNVFISAGYDKMIKAYDSRIGGLNEKNVIFKVDHGTPVESVMFLPTGGIFLSAGDTEIKVWDAFTAGKLIAQISQHHKTVTCLRMASNGRRFMSAGLDRHVKVYDIVTYKPVHSFDFPNAIVSLGVAPNDETLVAGMVDGLISIQRMDEPMQSNEKLFKQRKKITTNVSALMVDEMVEDYERLREAKCDKFLRKYDYSGALDSVLLPYIVNKTPHVTVALMQELIRRKGLSRALAGRTNESLAAIVRFIYRYIGDHRFSRILIDVTHTLLSVYEEKFDQIAIGALGKEFLYLVKMLHKEEKTTADIIQLQGAIELIMAGASAADQNSDEIFSLNNIGDSQRSQEVDEILPSEDAKENIVVNVN